MTKTRSGRSGSCQNNSASRCQQVPADRRSPADPAVLYGRSVFVITFRKNLSTGPKICLERRFSRFSTICAKNQVLNLVIDKVTVILRRKGPFLANPPYTYRCVQLYMYTPVPHGTGCIIKVLNRWYLSCIIKPYRMKPSLINFPSLIPPPL